MYYSIIQVESEVIMTASGNEDEGYQTHLLVEEESEESVQSKGKQRPKGKKKKKKKNRPQEWARQAEEAERKRKDEDELQQIKKETQREHPDVEVEYIQDTLEMDMSDPMYRQFSKIFEVFKIAENDEEIPKDKKDTELDKDEIEDKNEDMKKVPHMLEEDDMVEEEEPDENKDKLSKRKLKKLNRLSVAELKQLVPRPDVVEMHDVTAKGNTGAVTMVKCPFYMLLSTIVF
jgi:splicing factor 3B subunit 2